MLVEGVRNEPGERFAAPVLTTMTLDDSQCQCGGCISCERNQGVTPVPNTPCLRLATRSPMGSDANAPAKYCYPCWVNSSGERYRGTSNAR